MAELISRLHLNTLRGKDFVKESEMFDYNEFIAWHSKKLNDANDMESVWPYVKLHLKPLCPPIKLVGVGSSRAAFALQGGKCLKVAMNMHGFSLNEVEVEISKNSELFSCFTKVYSYDLKTNGSILTECCSEAKDVDFMQHFGCTDESIIHMLLCLIENEGDLHRAHEDMDEFEFRLWKKILNPKTPSHQSLADLVKWYESKSWDESDLIAADLTWDNWGIACRGNDMVLVVLDYGYNAEVNALYHTSSSSDDYGF